MKIFFPLCLILLYCIPCFGQATNVGAEEQLVRKVVESYLNKTDRNALHSDAKIFSLDQAGNKLVESPFRPGKLRKGETVGEASQRIISIDLANDGAVAKVETAFQPGDKPPVTPQKHIQYISLLKVAGEWKIVNILMPPLKFSAGR